MQAPGGLIQIEGRSRTSRTVSTEGIASEESCAAVGELSGQTQTAPARTRVGNASTQAAELQHAVVSAACIGQSKPS